jgi:hypothetical protein
MGVTSGGLDGEDTTLDVEEGHIESSTTKIEDEDVALLGGLSGTETVGDGSGSGLVDDTEDVETGNGTSILGGLTLVVVEVGRDGNDSLLNALAKLGLGNLLHLDENHGGDFLGGETLGLAEVLDLDDGVAVVVDDLEGPRLDVGLDGRVVESPTNETLGIENSVAGVERSLVFRSITDQTLLLGEGNERRSNTVTLLVGNNLNTGALVDGDTGVGGTKIDTDRTLVSSLRHDERCMWW